MNKDSTAKKNIVQRKGWFRWRYIRYISQAFFIGLIIFLSYRHLGFATKLAGPIDTYCPFGGVALLPKLATTGEFIRRTGDTNIVLLVGLVLAILVFGNAACGWVCPLGSVFEWLYRLRAKIIKKRILIPEKMHIVLRWFRYVVLALILVMTFIKTDLWFKAYDPYSILFSWGHAADIVGIVMLVLLLVGGLFVERFFCLYMCPLGGVMHPIAKASATGITRYEDVCINCGICDKVCPYRIPVSKQIKIDRGSCIECLSCLDECPVPGSLEFTIGWGGGK